MLKINNKNIYKHGLSKKYSIICADALINAELVELILMVLQDYLLIVIELKKVINPNPKIKIKIFHLQSQY